MHSHEKNLTLKTTSSYYQPQRLLADMNS